MKIAASVALFATAQASLNSFPKFDWFHASCALNTVFHHSCADTWEAISQAQLTKNDPASGTYGATETAQDDYLWFTRTTPVKHYVDDVLFMTRGADDGCEVISRSRSQSLSFYDYDTNFCNMYNIFRMTGLTFDEPKKDADGCRWFPSNVHEDTCNKY